MLLQTEHVYAASPDEVFEMLADPAFRARVCEAQNVVSHDIDITPSGDGFTLVNSQVQRTEGLPAIAKKFTGDTTLAIQREQWDDRSSGSLEIEAPGKPSRMQGTITLTEAELPDGSTGTVETVELDIRIKVPVIGGKLEGLLKDTVAAGVDIEFEVGDAWLAGDR